MRFSIRVDSRFYAAALLLSVAFPAVPQDDPKDRIRAARDLSKGGSESIAKLAPMIADADREVRLEVVKSIVAIGSQHSLDPLIQATRDNDSEIQIRATDGIVNFYLPGYLQSGLQRFGSAVRSRFDQENTQAIDPFVTVREDAIAAMGRLVTGGSSMESRANAARAVGILRGKSAVPHLVQALQSKDDALIFESLIALQKIGDPSAGPKVVFLVRDLQERVQIAAIETLGLLRNREAVPDLMKVYSQPRNEKIRKAAIGALAMLATPENRAFFERALLDKNEEVRAAAAEGLARLKDPANLAALDRAFNEEDKMRPRLAAAFALVGLGKTETSEFAPLPYLVNTLNSRGYRQIVEAYLTELARAPAVRSALYTFVNTATKNEKLGLGRVLAASGDRESLPHLERLSKDPDGEVAQESVRAIRNLRARLP